jgi:hypothetical protein
MELLKVNSDTLVVRIKNANFIIKLAAGIPNILGRFLDFFYNLASTQGTTILDKEFLKTITPDFIYKALLFSHRSNDPDVPLASLFQAVDIAKRENTIRDEQYQFLKTLQSIASQNPKLVQTTFPQRKDGPASSEEPLGKEDEPKLAGYTPTV